MSAWPSTRTEGIHAGGFGRHVALIGYRAVGKSTIGALVARRARWAFVDADHEIERRAGRSIAEIFANDGETVFRDWEAQVIAEILAGTHPVVLATGGGAILRAETRALLRQRAFVIWLTADPTELRRRLALSLERGRSGHRPALTSAGLLEEIELILAARAPLYRATAHAEVAGLNRSVTEVAADVYRLARSCFEVTCPLPAAGESPPLLPEDPSGTATAVQQAAVDMESPSRRSS